MKIKAYTLMEITVAMLLSAITISICYAAYQITTQYFSTFGAKNAEAEEVLTFRHVMERDIQKSSYALKREDGIELLADSTRIIYSFTGSVVIREMDELKVDTFKLKTSELKMFFEQAEVTEPDTIDQFSLKLQLGQNSVPLHFIKYYSAKDLFR